MGKTTKQTFEQFLVRATEKHSGKYVYVKSSFSKLRDKLKILCPKHGVFYQQGHKHLNGQGCPTCGVRKAPIGFVEQARAKHGDKYDYSLVRSGKRLDKIDIICPKHGVFSMSVNMHLAAGCGCKKCFNENRDKDTFISKAKELHKGKYKYDKVEDYTKLTDKVTICCDVHGEFKQSVRDHLLGKGCAKCGATKPTDATRHTKEDFVERAVTEHGNKYDYSLVDYKNSTTKVKIVCKEHGVFEQAPYSHLAGSGCASCQKNGFDVNKPATFYIVSFGDYVGFGVSNDKKTRLNKHRRSTKQKNYAMSVVHTIDFDLGRKAKDLENRVQDVFSWLAVDTGIEGFRTEALTGLDPKAVVDYCESWVRCNHGCL